MIPQNAPSHVDGKIELKVINRIFVRRKITVDGDGDQGDQNYSGRMCMILKMCFIWTFLGHPKDLLIKMKENLHFHNENFYELFNY